MNKSYIFPSILQTENIHRYSRLLRQTPPDVIKEVISTAFNYVIFISIYKSTYSVSQGF